jgi:hypothetical protein
MVSQKKNTKLTKTETPPVVENPPVVESAPVVVASVKTAQKGGAKKTAVKNETLPVVESPPVVVESASNTAQKGGAKRGNAKKAVAKTETPPVVESPPVVEASVKSAQKGGGKKAAPKTETPPVVEAEVGDELDGKSRSFKVKLPGDEEFSGRFTGLTPYQAANKALSKYFRTNDNNNITADQVIFSIKESTRGSKRHEYTYKGSRIKLEQPITYTIKSADGTDRVITKQYKNQLTKVKKGNATTVAPVANA